MPTKPFSFTQQVWSRISPNLLRRVHRAIEKDESVDSLAAWIRLAMVEKLERDELKHV